ncbi:MAG: hypothetical protein ACI4JS_11695 [Oscillospiraceae bacterium]
MNEEMINGELLQRNIEEFSRLQDYMQMVEKDSAVYNEMKKRYIQLKVILTALSVSVSKLDRIKE